MQYACCSLTKTKVQNALFLYKFLSKQHVVRVIVKKKLEQNSIVDLEKTVEKKGYNGATPIREQEERR